MGVSLYARLGYVGWGSRGPVAPYGGAKPLCKAVVGFARRANPTAAVTQTLLGDVRFWPVGPKPNIT